MEILEWLVVFIDMHHGPKKLSSQFQKEYPDIYSRRFPNTESEAQLFADKPKIKPPMLIGMRKANTFSLRN